MSLAFTRILIFLAGLSLVQTWAEEEPFRFAGIFTDDAVFQRDQPIPVWGFAEPATTVTVSFAGQEKTTTTNAEGRWQVALDPLSASNDPRELKATSGDQALALQGILIGEVWLCSGQSNMAMIVDRAKDPSWRRLRPTCRVSGSSK